MSGKYAWLPRGQYNGCLGMNTSNEACLSLPCEEHLAETINAVLSSYCKGQRQEGKDFILELDCSRAIIRPMPGMLWLRVDASDLLSCIGTKMLLESAMVTHRDDAPRHVLWMKAEEEPFAAVREILHSGQITAC